MLLKSDVARLVLGYLAEENCAMALQTFLNESAHLAEIRHLFSEELSSDIPHSLFGKSLYGILNEYYVMKDAEMQLRNLKNNSHGKTKKFIAMWKKLEDDIARVKSFQISSILDRFQIPKLYCKKCQARITQNGTALVPCDPAGEMRPSLASRLTQKQPQNANRPHYRGHPISIQSQPAVDMSSPTAEREQSFGHHSADTFLPSLDVTPTDPSDSEHIELHNRRKKQRAPRKLTDAQRKNKLSYLNPDPSDIILKNISGPETMAAVGATIIKQMKKCANNENSPESSVANRNITIDAVATKHNVESIVQMSMESLVHSDFTVADMELGKELEDLLGIPSPGVPSFDLTRGNNEEDRLTTSVDDLRTPREENPSPIFYLGDPVTINKTPPAESNPSTILEASNVVSGFQKGNTLSEEIADTIPTELNATDKSIVSNNTPNPVSISSVREVDAQSSTPPSVDPNIVSNPIDKRLTADGNCNNKNNEPETQLQNVTPSNSKEGQSSNQPRSSQDVNVEMDFMNDSDIPVDSSCVVIESSPRKTSDIDDLDVTMTPRKLESDASFNWNESPAKNTRSKTKVVSGNGQKQRIKIVLKKRKKSEKSDRKKKKNSSTKKYPKKKVTKTKKKTPKKKSPKTEDSTEIKPLEITPMTSHDVDDVPPSSDESPTNILTAVNLQNTPRKFTLRYGLRSTIVDAQKSPDHSSFSHRKSPFTTPSKSSLSVPSSRASISATPSCLRKIKSDLFSTMLIDSQPTVTKVNEKVDFVSDDITELNPITSHTSEIVQQTDKPSSDEIDASKATNSRHDVPAGETVEPMSPKKPPSITSGASAPCHKSKTTSKPIVEIEPQQILSSDASVPSTVDETSIKQMETPIPVSLSSLEVVQPNAELPEASPSKILIDGDELIDEVFDTSKATSVKNIKDRDIDNLFKKTITGESLTVLLNETSLTQMIEAAAKDETENLEAPKTEEKSAQFRTISPTAGVFSVLEQPKESQNNLDEPLLTVAALQNPPEIVNQTQSQLTEFPTPTDMKPVLAMQSESQMATENLRAWLNSHENHAPAQNKQFTIIGSSALCRPVRKAEAVCRTLDFKSNESNSRRNTRRAKPITHRKILPKKSVAPVPGFHVSALSPKSPKFHRKAEQTLPPKRLIKTFNSNVNKQMISASIITSNPSTSIQRFDPTFQTVDIVTAAVSSSGLLDTVGSHPLQLPDLSGIEPVNSTPIQNTDVLLQAIPVSEQITIGSEIQAVTVSTNFTQLQSAPSTPKIATTAVKTTEPLLSHSTSTTSTHKSPLMSTQPFISLVNKNGKTKDLSKNTFDSKATEPNQSEPVISTHSTKEPKTNTDQVRPEPVVSVTENHQQSKIVESWFKPDKSAFGSPLKSSERGTAADSSEEHSLRIITSDEERIALPGSRKRKQGRKHGHRKKPRLENFEKASKGDLQLILQKLYARNSSQNEKELESNDSKTKKYRSVPDKTTRYDQKKPPKSPQKAVPISIEKTKQIAPIDRTKSRDKHEDRRKHGKERKKSPPKLISPLGKDKIKKKRRISLTSIPIPPSKLGGSPLHLRTPSPVLVCRDSPNTIAQVAESLVELSRSCGSFQESTINNKSTTPPITLPRDNKSVDTVSLASSSKTKRKKHKKKKRSSFNDTDVARFLANIKYD